MLLNRIDNYYWHDDKFCTMFNGAQLRALLVSDFLDDFWG